MKSPPPAPEHAARRIAALALAALIVLLPLVLEAQGPALEQAGAHGAIDWTAGRATATGTGAPPAHAANAAQARIAARRAAVLDARRNLLEVVRQVRIDSETRVENLIVTGDIVLSRVEGVLVQAVIDSETPLADGSWRVTVSVPLAGNLSREVLAAMRPAPGNMPPMQPNSQVAALEARVQHLERTMAILVQALRERGLPSQTGADAARLATLEQRLAALEQAGPTAAPPRSPDRTAATAATPPAAAAMPAPPVPLSPAESATAKAATGLVVDVRGSGFTPSLKPRIVHGGTVLYPSPTTDFETGVSQGYARFYRDVTQAQQNPLAGPSPHTIRATAQGSDLMVSDADAAFLRQVLSRSGNFLDQCKVAVVF